MSAKCSYAGVILDGHASITWSLTAGVTPFVTSIEVSVETAEKVASNFATDTGGLFLLPDLGDGILQPIEAIDESYNARQAVEARLKRLELNGDIFEGVHLVRIEPAQKYTRRLILADRRWLWTRQHIERGYNVRRHLGEKVMVGDDPITAPLVDVASYASWSLNGEKRWTYQEVLADVFGARPLYDTPRIIASRPTLAAVSVDDLYLSGSYSQAISQVLSLHGGLSCWINPQGETVIASKIETQARPIIDQPGQVAVGGGWLGKADRRFERPAQVTVKFDVETELRFDYEEEPSSSTTNDPVSPPLDMENVIPWTEVTNPGRGRGNWVTIQEFLTDLPKQAQYRPPADPSVGTIDLPTYRRNYMRDFIEKRVIGTDLSYAGVSGADAFWARVMRLLKGHYRRTFRINQYWRDRIRQLRAYRLSNIDVVTGTRGTAEAFCDYTLAYSGRALQLRALSQGPSPQVVVDGYAERLEDAIPAPADVSITDSESGIVRVYLMADTAGDIRFVIPGKIDKPFTIRANTTDLSIFATTVARCGLSEDYKLALVLTAMLAPGNFGAAVYQRDSSASNFTSSPALGPPLTVKIAATPQTVARLMWSDDRGEDIRRFAANGGFIPSALHANIQNKDTLDAFADAVARSVYEMFDADQAGSALYPAAPGHISEPFGSVSSVRLTVNTDGSTAYGVSSTLLEQPRQWQTNLPPTGLRAIAGLVLP